MPFTSKYLIPENGLKQWIAADETPPTDGKAVSCPDLSPEGNTAAATPATAPAYVEDVLNGLPVFRFNGSTTTPLVNESIAPLTVRHIFIVAKYSAATFAGVSGLISSTGAADSTFLVGQAAASIYFYDLAYGSNQAYYKKGVAYGAAAMKAPMNEFAVLEVSYPTLGIPLTYGLQVGRDRANTARIWNGDVAEWMVWDRELTELERVRVYQYFAKKYHLWEKMSDAGLNIFPFSSDWNPEILDKKLVLFDEAEDGTENYRTKRAREFTLELNFTKRTPDEPVAAAEFMDEHFPGTRFVFRDKTHYPPRLIEGSFGADSEVKAVPSTHISNAYKISVRRGENVSAAFVPPLETVIPTVRWIYPEEEEDISGANTELAVDAEDDVALDRVEFYDDEFQFMGYGEEFVGLGANYRIEIDTADYPTGAYTFYAVAFDEAGNQSATAVLNVTISAYGFGS